MKVSEGMKKIVDEILQMDEPKEFVDFPVPVEGIHKIERVLEYLTLLLHKYEMYLISDFVREVVHWGWITYTDHKFSYPHFPTFPLPSLLKTVDRRRGHSQYKKDRREMIKKVWKKVISPPPKLRFSFNFKVFKEGESYVCGTTFIVRRSSLPFLLETVGERVLSRYLQGEPISEIEVPSTGTLVGVGTVLIYSNPHHAIVTFSPLNSNETK